MSSATTFPIAAPVVSGPSIVADQNRVLAAKKGSAGIVLAFDEALDVASAENLANYRVASNFGRDRLWATPDDQLVELTAAEYDPADRSVTLTWAKSPKGIFHVSVNGNAGVRSAQGNLIDGDGDGQPGGDYRRIFGSGTKLKFLDSDGDGISLAAKGGGPIDVVLRSDGSPELLRIASSVPGPMQLSGKVRQGRSGDGTVTFPRLVLGQSVTFRSSMTNPPFRIGPLSPADLDALLAASDGTLANLLIAETTT